MTHLPEQSIEEQIDEIVFRCFDQGVYWGKLVYSDGGERPDKPEHEIDRTQAVAQLLNLINEAERLAFKRGYMKGYRIPMLNPIDKKGLHPAEKERIQELKGHSKSVKGEL